MLSALEMGWLLRPWSGYTSCSLLCFLQPSWAGGFHPLNTKRPDGLFWRQGLKQFSLALNSVGNQDDLELLIFLLLPPRAGITGVHHYIPLTRYWGWNPGGFRTPRKVLYQMSHTPTQAAPIMAPAQRWENRLEHSMHSLEAQCWESPSVPRNSFLNLYPNLKCQ